MKKLLALDGPLNGSYISEQEARDEYLRTLWPSGEEVYVHYSSKHVNGEYDPDPIHPEDEKVIRDIVLNAPLH